MWENEGDGKKKNPATKKKWGNEETERHMCLYNNEIRYRPSGRANMVCIGNEEGISAGA